jgi:methanogenic corrinoid protein MtbC1
MNSVNQTLCQTIESQKEELARHIVEEQWERNPKFQVRYGTAGQAKCVQDVKYNLAYLSQAIESDSPLLFTNYIDWVKVLFKGLNIPTQELKESLEITSELLQDQSSSKDAVIVKNFIDAGLNHLASTPEFIASFIDETQPFSALARQYMDILQCGDRANASRLILDAVAQGISVKDIYMHVFQPCQYEIGRLWQMNQLSVAQEHYFTAVTQLIMSQLYSNIFNIPKNGRRLVAVCVGNELHEIGLRMVADFFEMEGWDTYYLGSNMPTASVVKALDEQKADVLAISATMTFHVKLVEDLIKKVRAANPNRQIIILTGGYPFNLDRELWRQVGADGYAINAEQALITVNAIMDEKDRK